MSLSWKERAFLALLGAATASGLVVLILILVEASSVLLPADTKFGIVFDAGSSHTSLFLYQWQADKKNNSGVISQALACHVEGPGISSYASDPTQAGESLKGCLGEALGLIPKAQHRDTATFLGATAGMRLRQKNGSLARGILAAVTRVLSQSPVDFWGAEILTGRDEGSFAWITINYALGRLVKYSSSGEWIQPAEWAPVGILDMGGASTQISFVPAAPILDQSTQTTFRLYGRNYSVYTHSYLCYGRDAALGRLLAALVQSGPQRPVHHPCYHSGYQVVLPPAALHSSPCTSGSAAPEPPWNLTVLGTGNPAACLAAIRALFNFSSCAGQRECAFNGVYQPPLRGRFYVEASYPGQERWLCSLCASGLYILTLLQQGYGFSADTWPSIDFQEQAGGVDIGWTLGYMLNLTGMIPAEAPAPGRVQSYGVWTAGIVFLVLTIGTVLGAGAVQLLWPQE
ncbi:ectonucleoside triphosphate diphosphohydrolase 8 isoform X3 [Dipodomys spectabilis]|uniref:ectonucleoside triphosphate diphosphohydrolase 8 isoform X3 n=1 Tax=Dipodomys spectabilis TaxID=105255 RepID=UPI001C538641|nr:ectonucleoside triphosphate diphosphohydrolase 8 isoform X3 [Dipodomys spectabilis]